MSKTQTPIDKVVIAIGRDDADFLAALPGEAAYAEEYRRRVALTDPAAPDEDEFAQLFRAYLSVLSAARGDMPIDALTTIAKHHVLLTSSIDLEDADLREPTKEAIVDAIATRIAADEVDDANDAAIEGNSIGTAQEIRSRTQRHRAVALRRLETMPCDENRGDIASRLDMAITETILIAGCGTRNDQDEAIQYLVDCGAIEADQAQVRRDPRSALVDALVAGAERAHLDPNATRTAIERAIDSAFAGTYGSIDALTDLPAAGTTGDEANAYNMVLSLTTCAATMLHIGGVLDVVGPSAEALAGPATAIVLREMRQGGATGTPRELAESAIDAVRDACNGLETYHDRSDMQSPGEAITRILEDATSDIADYVLTTGELMSQPAFTEQVGFTHAVVAHDGVSDAARRRLRSALAPFLEDQANERDIPVGTLWTNTATTDRSWRDVMALAKALASPSGVRYAALPLIVGRNPLTLLHDGRRASLIDISVTPPTEPGGTTN